MLQVLEQHVVEAAEVRHQLIELPLSPEQNRLKRANSPNILRLLRRVHQVVQCRYAECGGVEHTVSVTVALRQIASGAQLGVFRFPQYDWRGDQGHAASK